MGVRIELGMRKIREMRTQCLEKQVKDTRKRQLVEVKAEIDIIEELEKQ